MKNNPLTFRHSIVLLDNSSVSRPPAVTSAFSQPSVSAGLITHSCTCFSSFASESFRQNSKKRLLRRGHVAHLSRANRGGHLAFWSKVDSNRLPLLPVRRDL